MSKRKIDAADNIDRMATASKQIKLTASYSELLDDIDFDEFDDDITSSEEISTSQSTKESDQAVGELLNGVDFDSSFALVEDKQSLEEKFLNLTTWKRCKITGCQWDATNFDQIITGHEDTDGIVAGKLMVCRLKDAWSQCRIADGDIVSIKAKWIATENSYCVTSNEGFIVVRPDLLVSGTTVVGGLFCMRKTILADRFKGIEAGLKIV